MMNGEILIRRKLLLTDDRVFANALYFEYMGSQIATS